MANSPHKAHHNVWGISGPLSRYKFWFHSLDLVLYVLSETSMRPRMEEPDSDSAN